MHDLATREGAKEWLALRLDLASEFFNNTGGHPLWAAVLATRSWGNMVIPEGSIGVIDIPATRLPNDTSKDDFVRVVEAVVERTTAVGVLTLFEAWLLVGTDAEKAKGKGSIAGHPRRQECIYASFEHIRMSPQIGVAYITRNGGSKPTLGPFTFQPLGRAEGRFANMLARERFA